MLDNDEIAGDVGDARDAKTAENAGDKGDTGDVGEAKNAGDTGDTGEAGDKEVGRGNERGEQEDAEVGNDERGHSGDQEAGKVGDGVGIGRVPKDVKLDNDGVGDSAGNQINWRATVEYTEDSNNIVVDPTDGIFTDILAYPFGPSSLRSNSPPGVIAACSVQSHGNKFQFLFISLLTLLQRLNEFLISGVVIWLALPALSPHRSGAKRFVAATTRAFSMGCICLLALNLCLLAFVTGTSFY